MKTTATGPIISNRIVGEKPEWWVKIVEFLNQNWALPVHENSQVTLLLVGDTSGTNGGVFDRLTFDDIEAARRALRRNGFKVFSADPGLAEFLAPPELPLREGRHPNGPIYSSGQFWH
jgi:hypothetical protein